jgi:hypothetical protein
MSMLREKFLTTWTPFAKQGSALGAYKGAGRIATVSTDHHVLVRVRNCIVRNPRQAIYQGYRRCKARGIY